MRILDLGEFYSERGGGVRSYLSGLLEASAARGHEVVLLVPGPKDSDERVPGGRIVRYRAPRMPYDPTYHVPYRLSLARQRVRELAPDVLQLSSPYLPWLTARGLSAPVRSYVYHSDPIGAYVAPLAARCAPPLAGVLMDVAWRWMRAVCNCCDVTVVAGDWLQHELSSHGIQRARAVPFGIAHERFRPIDAAKRSPARLLIAGRLAVEKRQAVLLRAVAKLSETRNVELCILGDGPEAGRLRALAERLLPQTRFIPFTRDAAEYAQLLASADVLLHGSRCETYGFVLVEALASGTPLCVPDAGGAPQLASGDACVTYPAGAGPDEIAGVIAGLLDRPRSESRRAARAAAERHPSRQEHYDALFALYGEMLARRRGEGANPRAD